MKINAELRTNGTYYVIEKTDKMPPRSVDRCGLWMVDTRKDIPYVWIGCPFCGSLNDVPAYAIFGDGRIGECFICKCGRRMFFRLRGWKGGV